MLGFVRRILLQRWSSQLHKSPETRISADPSSAQRQTPLHERGADDGPAARVSLARRSDLGAVRPPQGQFEKTTVVPIRIAIIMTPIGKSTTRFRIISDTLSPAFCSRSGATYKSRVSRSTPSKTPSCACFRASSLRDGAAAPGSVASGCTTTTNRPNNEGLALAARSLTTGPSVLDRIILRHRPSDASGRQDSGDEASCQDTITLAGSHRSNLLAWYR